MSELKPCPFCGGMAKIYHSNDTGTDKVLVECEVCFSQTNYYQIELSAINSWNIRMDKECISQVETGSIKSLTKDEVINNYFVDGEIVQIDLVENVVSIKCEKIVSRHKINSKVKILGLI